ncbi:hypothetical protein V8E53_011468 [Lactarius tabidus]
MSPTASEAPGAQFGANHTSLPDFPEDGKTPGFGNATLDGSFSKHDTYFFKDGNVTFLIDGMLYCVHRYFFSRDSIYFSTRFAQLGIRDHEALPTIISIGDVERNDFEALLSVLYPADFETQELTYEQWKSVLHLSTRWDFATLRNLALKSIRPPTSHDQLVLARTYSVDQWVLPALTALCSRTLPLSLDEARQMNMEDVILVATVREEIRDGALRVDVADIPRCVEAAQAGKLNRPVGDRIYRAFNPKVETEDAKAIVTSPLGPRHRDTTEGDSDESEVERSKNAAKKAATEARIAEAKAEREAVAKAKAEAAADAKATREAEAKARAKVRAEAEARRKREAIATAEALAYAEAEARAYAEAKARAKAEAEAWAKAEAEARVKAEDEAWAK